MLTDLFLMDCVWIDAFNIALLIDGLALIPAAQGLSLAIAKLDPYRSTY